MRRSLFRASALLIAVLALACGGGAGSAPSSKLAGTLYVGVSLPLSGKVASLGTDAQRGLLLGQAKAEKDILGGAKLNLDVRDDMFTKEQTVVNFQQFLGKKPSAIIGPLGSLIANAALPIAQQNGIPAVTLSAPDSGLTKIGDNIFSTLPFMADTGPPALLVGLDKASITYKKPAMLTSQDYQTGAAFIASLTSLLDKKGIKPAFKAAYSEKDTDFAPQIALIKNAGPDAIFVSGGLPATGLLIKQLRAANVSSPIIGDIGETTPSFAEQVGAAKEGVVGLVYWDPTNPSQTATSIQFVKDYKAKYNADPSLYSAIAYDSVLAVAHALAQAGSGEPAKVRAALADLKPFEGVMGKDLKFSADQRTITAAAVAVGWKGDKLTVLGAK